MSLPDLRSLRAVGNWRRQWPGQASEVLENVRVRLVQAVEAWALREVRPLGAGEVAVVLSARSHGRDVVVKANPRVPGHTDELDGEAAGLAFWAPTGAVVAPLDSRDGGATMLLERLYPGTALREANRGERKALGELGSLAGRLHAAGRPPDGTFLPLKQSSLGRRMIAALESEPEAPELADLLRPDPDDVLIHADLHSLNALQAGETLKAIDPKPHLADRHAEVFVFVLEPFFELPEGRRDARALAAERLKRYAKAADLDLERAGTWTRILARAIEQQLRKDPASSDWELAWAQRLSRLATALH